MTILAPLGEGALRLGFHTLRATAAAALTICTLACGTGTDPKPAPTGTPTPPAASPPVSVSAQMAQASAGTQTTAPRREIDWSIIHKDPWVTKLGRFDQVVEAESVCLGPDSGTSPRCRELRRMMDKTVNEAQVRATVDALQKAWPALTRVWTAAFAREGRTFALPKIGYYGWSGGGIPSVRTAKPDCPPRYDNALYCEGTHEVFYDAVFLTRIAVAVAGENRTSGQYAAISVIAHELGHAADAQIGASEGVRYREELLGDCFSGAAMGEVSRAEAGASKAAQLIQSTTPLAEGQLAAYLAGGPVRQGDYESGPVRADYFTRGFNLGIASCAPAVKGKK